MTASAVALGLPLRANGRLAPDGPARPIMFANFRLFDGISATLRDGLRLLVESNRIKAVATGNPATPDNVRVIDCGGRVIMPGLIDAHWHALFAAVPLPRLLDGDSGYTYLAAGAEAERTLLRGFTTIRDLGGPVFALKQAIDEGLVPGPRIYPSGAMITSTGGHADLRPLSELPRNLGAPFSSLRQAEGSAVADGADEVRLRVREQLMQGASQIKVVGGGGVSSPRSPLDTTTFSEPELRAAVEAAAGWNTFVTVHAYAPSTIQRAIAAGAKCIEHAHLMDDATAQLMADNGIWLSIQPFLSDEDMVPLTGARRAKQLKVFAATDSAYALARKHGVKTAFGSDLLFSEALATRQSRMLTHLTRWYSNFEILRMATAGNAELLGLSGPRNPYPGKLGIIEVGALADLLLVDGNPLEEIALIAEPDKNFSVIMKDGILYKDALAAAGLRDH
jgi:imidazolonepropionase-like amidohydrolase